MNASLVIEHIVSTQGINLNTLVDKDFSQQCWLNAREPIINDKGEKVSKSYYYQNKQEAVRIEYHKIIGDYDYNGVVYPNTYLGWRKTMAWIDWAGNIGVRKEMQPYFFKLDPVFLGDGTETIVGFSSPKMRKSMKDERYAADDYLQAKNPSLYAILYANYAFDYDYYLKTGVKDKLVAKMNSETNEELNAVFNNFVYGSEITIKELIINNLQ